MIQLKKIPDCFAKNVTCSFHPFKHDQGKVHNEDCDLNQNSPNFLSLQQEHFLNFYTCSNRTLINVVVR